MNPLRVLIVDDEALARLRLRGLVEAISQQSADIKAQVVAEAASGTQAAQWLREHACDLILLDVQMPGPDGLQFAESLRDKPGQVPLVVFVTAHPAHAVEAFELQALDYLTKPVRRERLEAALLRACERLEERRVMQAFKESGEPLAEPSDADFLTISERGRLVRVPLAEVLYFKADQKYLTVRTANEVHIMDGALSELEQRYADKFLRIHRNALVARSAVRQLERRPPTLTSFGELEPEAAGDLSDAWAVRVAHVDEWLIVSRRQVAAVREALAGHPARPASPG